MVTLDIEDTSIKIMAVRGRRVETAVSLPLEPGLVHDGVVTDTATVSRRIAELMSAQGINEKKVVVSISGIHSIYRTVNIPKLPKNLLDEAARREAERVMPVPLNELYTSWQAISMSDIETTLCIVGLPRNTVDAMLDTLRQAGLQPEAMDIRPLALARVADERDAIIINVRQTGFDIVVMVDGIPELLRSLPFPASAASVPDKISEVKEELERTVAFHNSSHKENPITNYTAAFVSGELGEMLAGTIEYRVKPLPQLLSYTDSLNTSEYATNIGLALKLMRADINQTQVNINVTPEAYLPKPFPIIQIVSWAFILVAIAVILLLAISTLQAVRQTQLLQAKVNSAQTQIQLRQGTEETIKQLQAKVDEAENTRDYFKPSLDSAEAQRAKVNGDLSKATSLLPGIAELNSISYSHSLTKGVAIHSLTITGIAPDETTIVNYVRYLRNSGQFSEVLISDMSELQFNEWKFTLAMK
ncbi:MAG: pilus assembly protein PilM [Chloroflexi bacterium]|nr:pilus assembly protein PilM [Chloroflexota bacterium]